MPSTFGRISRCANVAADSSIQRCSSSRCSNVNIFSALSLTGVVRNAVPASVGLIVVDMFSPYYLKDTLGMTMLCHPFVPQGFGSLSQDDSLVDCQRSCERQAGQAHGQA